MSNSNPQTNQNPTSTSGGDPILEVLAQVDDAPIRAGLSVTTLRVTLPPASAGTPPHRHPGPVFGYVVRGAVTFEVEGKGVTTLRAGDAFWEPGGDTIHYQDANALDDAETEFVVTLMLPPGADLLTLVTDEELAERADRRRP